MTDLRALELARDAASWAALRLIRIRDDSQALMDGAASDCYCADLTVEEIGKLDIGEFCEKLSDAVTALFAPLIDAAEGELDDAKMALEEAEMDAEDARRAAA